MEETNGQRALLTTAEVAQEFGVSDETVRRWVRRGVIKFVLVGPFRLKRIPRAELTRQIVPGRPEEIRPE